MTNDSKDKNLDTVIKDIKDAGETAKALTKINKEKAEVEFYEKQDNLDLIDLDEARLSHVIKELKDANTEETLKKAASLETALDELKKSRAELEKEKTKAILVPLKYRDYRIVQTAVTEALTSVDGMGFDMGTQILMILQERRLMTVYLSLRKHNDLNNRYYGSLEEISRVSDKTIESIYNKYCQEFELTELERKNS